MAYKILVVDDIPFNVALLKARLEQEYYEVDAAKNGIEALEKTRADKPDLILMDVMMPVMDGNEATKLIKSEPSLSTIPIVLVTALDAVEDKIKGLENGADDFITKPINDQTLIIRIKSLLRLKALTDELILRNQTIIQLGGSNVAPFLGEHKDFSMKGMKALLLDDDIGQIKKIENLLSSHGIKIEVFNKVQTAYENALHKNYDLLIVNVQMTEEDGLRFCSYISNEEQLRSLPILTIVDENNTAVMEKAFELGASDCISTPVETNELFARCSTQLRRKQYQDALANLFKDAAKLSIVDALTGLFNRRYFDVYVPKIMKDIQSKSKNLFLLILDMDFFKRINDNYGHQAGDRVLQYFAELLKKEIRSHDTCARIGGEEFVVVLSDIEPDLAKEVAERIRKTVEAEKVPINDSQAINITCSIGMSSMLPEDDINSLMVKADKSLYKSKTSGRNMVTCDF